ncbi:MAG: HAMP domain-containing histidine kinase [Clostridia bacterium]|nr:HAMP domain-containing histidine kinase [Clostridia bacterium]
MMLFLFLLLGLLWLFQVVFFGEIYKTVRISEIKGSADILCESIDVGDAELQTLALKTAREKQVCVLIFDEHGNIISTEDVLSDCIVHTMSARNIYTLYTFAERDGGEKLSRFHLDAFRNIRPEIFFYESGQSEVSEDDTAAESIIYTKVTYSESRGRDIVVMLNTTISPVASTVRTLQTELIIISILMALLAVLLSFLLARRISKPIVRISRSAGELARGNYDADFTADGYREIAELSDTLSYAAAELSKTGKLQRELIANISHDLRTPLTMITGYAEVMRDIPGENTPENVQIIIDEARRLSSLVNDVLDISKLQSGTQELDITEFNLTETVREVIGRFSRLTEQDGYTIEFASDCEVMTRADRTRILQVIYNFINNAITHSGSDKTVLVTQRVTRLPDGKVKVRISVTDHGEGIPQEALPNIWDRYYKVDKLHRRAQTGSGLGLSIVKHILDLHKATYGVDSREGAGSTFWFEL